MRMSAFALTAALAAFLSVPSAAAPVTFDESTGSPARQIVNVVFADYLGQRVGAVVQTATVDLDSDRTGEIVARFVHTGSCDADMKKCRTVVLRYGLHNWEILLDRYAETVEVLEQNTRIPSRIKVDNVTWRWDSPFYAPTSEGLGEKVELAEVPASSADALAAAFGSGAEKLVGSGFGVKLSFARPNLAEEETLLVKLDGDTVCGSFTGCPIRVLKKNGEKWSNVLESYTRGDVTLAKTKRQGFRDIVVETDAGFAVLGWTGNGYSVADRIEKVGGRE